MNCIGCEAYPTQRDSRQLVRWMNGVPSCTKIWYWGYIWINREVLHIDSTYFQILTIVPILLEEATIARLYTGATHGASGELEYMFVPMETKNNSNDTVRNNIVIIHVYVYIPFLMYHCYLMILWYHTILILIKLLRLGNTKNAFEQKLRLWWKTITLDYMSDWLSSAMYWTVLNDDHTITYL